jgi:hypothetical protein
MIEHLEMVIHNVLLVVGGWMCALAMTLVLALAACAFLCLNLYKFDRESCLVSLRAVARALSRGWGWGLMAALLLLQVYALTHLHQGLQRRLAQQSKALYLASEDRGGLPTTQRAPQVSVLESRASTQRIVLPPQLSSLEAVPGWTPEEARYGDRPAVNVQDELVQDLKAVVLNRTIRVDRFVPMKLQGSDVTLKLAFQDPLAGSGQLYSAEFQAGYTFQNPFPEARRLHFSFPLPDNSGTLAGFRFRVNGQEMPSQDVGRGLEWEGELQPQQKCVVEIAYQHRGARAWSYDVTGRREPIANFHLRVQGDRPDIKFQRGSLYPTKVQPGRWEWDLENQITSQSISLYFPYVPSEQVIGNLFVFGPLSLIALSSLIVVWARLRSTRTGAWRAALATLSSAGAFTLASYLVGYMSLAGSLLIAFGVAGWFQYRALGQRLWIPVASSSLAPFTFLAPGHTGLMLSCLGLTVLGLAIHETTRRDDTV